MTTFPRTKRRGGFTLLEILLVVAIMMIAAGVTVPLFARSFRDAELRNAARAVVTAAKYARNMAVLEQRPMTLFFDQEAGRVTIVAGEPVSASIDGFLVSQRGGGVSLPDGAPALEVRRQVDFPDDVQLLSFRTASSRQEVDGVYWVQYYPSGASDSYALQLADGKRQRRVWVEVDHLAGTMETRYE
jgi:Tfp pilus assembly protein FimT